MDPSSIYELTDACPKDKDNPNPCNCPLHPIRHLSRAERIKYIDNLSLKELTELSTYHKHCVCL